MDLLEKYLNNVAAGAILTVMMLLVTGDVIGRYLFNTPIHGTNELTEFMMVGLLYFTLSHAQALKAHIRVEFLIDFFSPRTKVICQMVCHFLGLFVFSLIAWQSMKAALQAWRLGETTFGLILFPLFPSKILVPMGSFLFSLRLFKDLVDDWKRIKEGLTE